MNLFNDLPIALPTRLVAMLIWMPDLAYAQWLKMLSTDYILQVAVGQ